MKETFTQILDYIDRNLANDPVYEWILRETAARGIPQIQITTVQGRVLNLLTSLVGARRALEIGALSGYSGVWIARALPPDGKLITLEMNERHAALARESFQRAGVADRVEVIVGPALESLHRLQLDAPLDLVFIDADKSNNLNYFRWALGHVRSGGLILVDNVFANGQATADQPQSEYARTIAEFNRYLFAHHNAQTTLIPFYKPDEDNLDGLAIVHVR